MISLYDKTRKENTHTRRNGTEQDTNPDYIYIAAGPFSGKQRCKAQQSKAKREEAEPDADAYRASTPAATSSVPIRLPLAGTRSASHTPPSFRRRILSAGVYEARCGVGAHLRSCRNDARIAACAAVSVV